MAVTRHNSDPKACLGHEQLQRVYVSVSFAYLFPQLSNLNLHSYSLSQLLNP
jgi:hypothetical protein